VTGLFVIAVAGFLVWLWRRGQAGDRPEFSRADGGSLRGAGQLE
jgi:hypothetical protein